MVRVSLLSFLMIVAAAPALTTPLVQSSLSKRNDGDLDVKFFGGDGFAGAAGAGIAIGGGFSSYGGGFTTTVSGLQTGCNTLVSQIQDCRSAIASGIDYQVAFQRIQQLAGIFSSFINSFMSCQSCFNSGGIGGFGGSLQALFSQFQTLISYCRQTYPTRFTTLISPLNGLNDLIGNFFSRVSGAGLGLQQCLPSGITSTFSSVGWTQASTFASSQGFQ